MVYQCICIYMCEPKTSVMFIPYLRMRGATYRERVYKYIWGPTEFTALFSGLFA